MEITIKINGSTKEILDLVNKYNEEVLGLIETKKEKKSKSSDLYYYPNYPFDVATSPAPEEEKK